MKDTKKILVIGSANVDFVMYTNKMPALGETATGKHFAINPGGKGLNQAVAIAKLGGNTSFVGAMGDDANAQILLNTLAQLNIPFQGTTLQNITTGIAMITVINGDNFILLHEGANGAMTPERIDQAADLIRDAGFLVLQLEIPMDAVLRACQIAKAAGTKVILNPAPAKQLSADLLSMVDYLIPNEHEAYALTGILPQDPESCIKAIHALHDMGAKNIVITLGSQGCAYTNGDDVHFFPAIATQVVDTTSAGDCFIGALVTKLSQGSHISDAIRLATQASAIAVSRPGAAASIPFANELQEDMK